MHLITENQKKFILENYREMPQRTICVKLGITRTVLQKNISIMKLSHPNAMVRRWAKKSEVAKEGFFDEREYLKTLF